METEQDIAICCGPFAQNLCSPAVIKALLNEYSLAPLKKLGQNFLCDENIVTKIAQAAVLPGENVLEIGPGLGVLSNALAQRAGRLVCIEIDAGMVRVLQKTLAGRDNVTVLHQDFLKTDIRQTASTYFNGEPFAVCGNLPYYITAKCIMNVLEADIPLLRFTAMVQKEVAQRLSSHAGETDYGALTAAVNFFGEVSTLFNVSRGCFLPSPDVDSAVISIQPDKRYDIAAKDYLRTVRALFAMRRKTAANNLRAAFRLDAQAAADVLSEAGIEPSIRAEQLSCGQFVKLTKLLTQAYNM